ncbi:hypothetical protein CI102_9313 [Trichoderma harzianum]|nr:hypothetical protein CI102_9313 [Trichoderma harzianum]
MASSRLSVLLLTCSLYYSVYCARSCWKDRTRCKRQLLAFYALHVTELRGTWSRFEYVSLDALQRSARRICGVIKAHFPRAIKALWHRDICAELLTNNEATVRRHPESGHVMVHPRHLTLNESPLLSDVHTYIVPRGPIGDKVGNIQDGSCPSSSLVYLVVRVCVYQILQDQGE